MGLEKRSLYLQIESPPSPICRDLADFQDLYKQITICDFYFLKGFTPAVEILGSVDTPHRSENNAVWTSCRSVKARHFGIGISYKSQEHLMA